MGYNLGHPAGLFGQSTKGQSVKARISFLAVVFGSVVFALLLADSPWPGK